MKTTSNILIGIYLVAYFLLGFFIPNADKIVRDLNLEITIPAIIGIELLRSIVKDRSNNKRLELFNTFRIVSLAVPIALSIILVIVGSIVTKSSGYDPIGINYFSILYAILFISLVLERAAFLLSKESINSNIILSVFIATGSIYVLDMFIFPTTENIVLEYIMKALIFILYFV